MAVLHVLLTSDKTPGLLTLGLIDVFPSCPATNGFYFPDSANLRTIRKLRYLTLWTGHVSNDLI